jgi:acyl transferase domain-containing protein/acyl carrier protein
MSRTPEPASNLSADQQTLLALRKLRARVDELERVRSEPIAIVGVGCRFPGGADGPDAYWRLLHDGVDAIAEVPRDRWDIDEFYDPDPDAPGKMYTRHGGFIERPDQFDPQFFGISPREAISIDPQHRLILEVCWEALEHAGQNPDRLHGEAVGVFVGISTGDYGMLHMQRADPTLVDTYFGIGNAANAAAGRVSYTLGLQGPSMAVDTACSSSLVAVHLACQSLRNGDCRMALAGGVNLILSPEITINFSRARMMAPDGRCKTFDAAADGYVRGEGCGVVVLKRLSDALADHDRVLAVVRGSAVNQDGRSSGFTAPNELAQQAVIRQALRVAGLKPSEVQYLEAHGTGTSLGDPIEVQAAAAAYGEGRAAGQPLKLGSAKTNVGHLEAAAGIAGLIKIVLSLQHAEIPQNLNFKTPNPYIPWAELPVEVVTERTAWTRGSQPRAAGVSSFGFSGTNAHVILGDAPAASVVRPRGLERPRHVLALSARSDVALRALAERYAGRLVDADPASLPDICHTANTGRAHFAYRLAATARSVAEMREALERFGSSGAAGAAGSVVTGEAAGGDISDPSNSVVFLFTGQGSQYPGMARRLFETQPSFRATLERCDEILRGHLEQPLLSVIYPAEGRPSPISETAYTQPALFAVEYAMAELWRSWGVEPGAVIGHSIGEYVAACVAGVIGVEDALLAVAARGRLMQALPAGGVMAAVFADAGRVRAALAGLENRLTIAAINAPENTVISGAADAMEIALAKLTGSGVTTQRLDVSHAFHSPLMEPMLDAFEREIASLSFRPPRLPIVSNLTGEVVPMGFAFDAAYWRRHAREAVRFTDGIRALIGRGHRAFLEVGPSPTLASFGRASSGAAGALWVASLRKGRDDWDQMLSAAGELYVKGCGFDWAGFDRDYVRDKVTVPTYPFQRERYWIDLPKVQKLPRVAAEPIYEVTWPEQPRPAGEVIAPSERAADVAWVIFRDRGGVGEALANSLASGGARVLAVDESPAGTPAPVHSPGAMAIDPRKPAQFAAIWPTLKAGSPDGPLPVLNVLYLWPLSTGGSDSATALQASAVAGCGGLLHLFQSLSAAGRTDRIRVTLVTRGALSVSDADVMTLSQAPLPGLLTTIAREFPEIACTTVDLAHGDSVAAGVDAVAGEAAALLREVAGTATVDRVAFRGGRRHVARLAPLRVALAAETAVLADASYLITGGLGALGLMVARWLVDRGARHLTLVGRREPSESARTAIGDLEAAGATITHSRADVTNEADVARLIEEIARHRPPLRGVVHAAGVRDDGVVGQQTWERYEPVLAPKVAGAWNLHARTRELPLDFFVLFSSSASVFGSAGQSNYAAANAFLGALAHERRRLGLPATSISWGPWADGGMATEVSDVDRRRWAQVGLELIQPVKGLAWLGRLAATPIADVVVLPVDWARFAPQAGEDLKALLADMVPVETAVGVSARAKPHEKEKDKDFRDELERTPRARRRAALEAHVRDHVRQVLALGPSVRLGAQDGFRDLGMDSLMAVDLRNRLQRALGCTLPATIAFDHPTVDALANYLGAEVLSAFAGETAGRAPQSESSGPSSEPIAIVGLGCRFPGRASDPEAFWQLLHDGVDAITEVPIERWDIDAFYDADPDAPGKMYTRWGGFLEGVDQFDPQFFGMAPREALSLDPQQRLLLEVSWEALEHAGQRPDALRGSATGVFVGISGNEYVGLQLRGRTLSDLDAYAGTGNAPSMAAGRLSFTMGLQGPSLAVDTACSSSLVAVHLACQSLRSGECRLALAGGVNLILTPTANVVLSRARMMSADGRCKTFDAAADGYVRGEGCGIVVLKRLSDALADGDDVLAVVRGTAVNQDGRSSGLTVPNGLAQETLLREALAQSGVAPEDVSYVEAHGTGTSLGDPIEVRALGTVFCATRTADVPLHLGSVKTNLGHLEAAAGVAGLIKTVLALRHEEIPPHLHFVTPNPLIPWADLPVDVPTSVVAWPRGNRPRVAGVSSFGFSGTNAHVVLEEAPAVGPAESGSASRPTHLLALSAKSEAGLRATAARFVTYLTNRPAADLSDVCFTANTGRAHFEYRLSVTAVSTDELRARLASYLSAGESAAIAHGRAEIAEPPDVAFLFTGEAAGAGVGRELFETQPTFRRAMERCAAVADRSLDRPLLEALYPADGPATPLAGTVYEPPALFAAEFALAELWRSWGVSPSVVMGQGMGEFVAGCVAGVFTLDDALQLVLAATQPEALAAAAARIAYQRPQIEIVSSETNATINDLVTTAAYWVDRARRRAEASRMPREEIVLEVGPRLTSWRELLESVAALEVAGVAIDWAGFDRDYPRRKVALPTYPFQKERYWIDPPAGDAVLDIAGSVAAAARDTYRDDWLYEVDWELQPAGNAAGENRPSSWLILGDGGDIGAQLASTLERKGATCLLVRRDEGSQKESRKKIDAFVKAGSSQASPQGVVYLSSAGAIPDDGARDVVRDAQRSCGDVLRLVQLLARADNRGAPAPRLWIATRGAQHVVNSSTPLNVADAPLWGLGRTIAAEHAAIWGGLVDLDGFDGTSGASAAASALANELLGSTDEDQVAIRGAERYVARLLNRAGAAERLREFAWRPDGAYLITGGFGGIGLEVARRMARQGARRLILLSRSAVPPRAEWAGVKAGSTAAARIAAIAGLESLGATVHVAAVDVGDEAALRAWLDTYRREQWPPIRGVVHAAGVTQYRALVDQGEPDLEEVWRGKVNGAWLLHRLFAETPLDCFVLFSSAASLLNSPMLGSYAAANAFLDALADVRRAQGLPVLSINWGTWSGVGMAAAEANVALQAPGRHEFISPDEGLRILSALLPAESARVAVLPMVWSEWRERYPAFARAPFLSRVIDQPIVAVSRRDRARSASMKNALVAATAPERRAMLTALVTEAVAGVVRLPGASLDADAPLRNIGLDSLMALEIRNQFQDRAGVTVPLVTIVEGPSIAELVTILVAGLDDLPLSAAPGLSPELTAEAPDPGRPGAETPAVGDLDELSDESVDAILRRMLAER